jgi:hypothetical protein
VLLMRGSWRHKWPWVDFFDDLIRNLLVGGLVAIAVVWLDQLQRERDARAAAEAAQLRQKRQVVRVKELAQLAASRWSPLLSRPDASTTESRPPDNAVAAIREDVKSLRAAATEIEAIYTHTPVDQAAHFALGTLRWKLVEYLREGGRARQFAYLDMLDRELATLGDAEGELGTAVRAFRASLPGVVAWRIHTDATILERLLVERVVEGATMEPATHRARELLDVVRLDAAAVAAEPLYLLLAYTVVQAGRADPRGALQRLKPAVRSLGALRNEIRAVATALELFASLREKAQTG